MRSVELVNIFTVIDMNVRSLGRRRFQREEWLVAFDLEISFEGKIVSLIIINKGVTIERR